MAAGGDQAPTDACPRAEVLVDDECHQVMSQGPCEDDEVVLIDPATRRVSAEGANMSFPPPQCYLILLATLILCYIYQKPFLAPLSTTGFLLPYTFVCFDTPESSVTLSTPSQYSTVLFSLLDRVFYVAGFLWPTFVPLR